MDDRERILNYYQEIDHMEKKLASVIRSCYWMPPRGAMRAQLIKPLIRLGMPSFVDDDRCPTACIALYGSNIVYMFGRSFYDKLCEEYANMSWSRPYSSGAIFVAAHEAMHLVFNHIERRGDRDPNIWNIAVDIVVNEMLIRSIKAYGEENIARYWTTIPDNIILASDFKVYRALSKNAERIYDELEQRLGHMRIMDPQGYESKLEEARNKGSTTGTHSNWDDLSHDAIEHKVYKSFEKNNCGENVKKYWGSIAGSEAVNISVDDNGGMCWDEILLQHLASKIDYIIQTHEVWAPASRRMYDVYPDVILPNILDRDVTKHTLKLLIAIDTSGSMSGDILRRFVATISKLPDKYVSPTVITFDVKAYPVPYEHFLDGDVQLWGRGGTDFEAIKKWINKQDDKFDQVVVLTDGYADRPNLNDEQKKRWSWVISPKGTTEYVEDEGMIIQMPKEDESRWEYMNS